MKRKTSSKSKDRDKAKSEEGKSHRHSRRRRKSESSDSSSASSDHGEEKPKHKDSPKSSDREEGRSTRHSRRIAGSSEESKDEKSFSLTLKIPKIDNKDNSLRDSKKKDTTPSETRVKSKEGDVWKVKSSNGSGAGELQKLKICRKRSPEPSDGDVSNDNVDVAENDDVSYDSSSRRESKESVDYNYEPAAEESSSSSNSGSVADSSKYITADSSYNTTADNVCDISLPPDEQVKQPDGKDQTYEQIHDDVTHNENTIIADVQVPLAQIEAVTPVITENEKDTGSENENTVEEFPPSSAGDSAASVEGGKAEKTEVVIVTSETGEPEQTPTDEVLQATEESVSEQAEEVADVEMVKGQIIGEQQQNELVGVSNSVEGTPEETGVAENKALGEEKEIKEIIACEEEQIKEVIASEEEQIKEVIATDENRNDDAVSVTSVVSLPTDITANDEEYDYEETEDTREEGEISGSEALSPVHQMYKKLRDPERARSWGDCGIFKFNRTTLPSSESILKAYKIEKLLSAPKDIMVDSDPEDLIFVKEIREDNIIHEVEGDNESKRHMDDSEGGTSEGNDGETKKGGKKNAISSPENIQVKITIRNENAVAPSKSSRTGGSSRSKKDDKRHGSPHKRSEKHSSKSSTSVSNVLYITNLVRPFTVIQLKELLQRTGKIAQDGFWIDAIKSKCYVQYEDEGMAVETRHALHGTHWPASNPKSLNVRFATQDDLLKAQTLTDVSEIPRKTEPLMMEGYGGGNRRVERINLRRNEISDDRPLKIHVGVREWDIGKPKNPDEMIYAETRKEKERDKKEKSRAEREERSRRSRSPAENEQPAKKQKKEESESKVLDDLFKRTKTTPCIYWLPLTPQQIVEKEEIRRQHLEVLNQRLAKKSPKSGDTRSGKKTEEPHRGTGRK